MRRNDTAITANAPSTADSTVWHALPADDVVKRLATHVDQGLDAGIIFAAVLLNALLGLVQEGKAEKALDSMRNMLSAEARTTRGGETRMIPADELTPGDIVLLESGDKVPADLRLVDARNLRTEEAALTGESVLAEKTTDPTPEKSTVEHNHWQAFDQAVAHHTRAWQALLGPCGMRPGASMDAPA